VTSRLVSLLLPKPRDEWREVREVFGMHARARARARVTYRSGGNTPRTSRTSRLPARRPWLELVTARLCARSAA
jgi:hypothetical protein